MTRRWVLWGLAAVLIVALGAGLYGLRRVRGQTPLSITGPNILQNNDFALDADADRMPDGWTRGATGVELGQWAYRPDTRSMQILGSNNYLQSPFIAARPGVEYRVAFRALADRQPTQARVWFHWRNAEGIAIQILPGEWQPVPAQQWGLIKGAAVAPEGATELAISIHPVADDAIFVADLSLGQLGVRVNPWPEGKRAALAFSFDYETAMGGLIHSRSVGDPNADGDPVARGLRMRAGAEQALALFAPHGIRATFYTNGYNFLTGNPERRQFMGNPTYAWANTDEGHFWKTDQWRTTPWFSPDPYQTEAEAPAWYFGSQIAQLQAAGQDIQSHTFAHFAGTYVTPEDWRADLAAWKEVAAERGVPMATSLAFPWSSSAGMGYQSWQVLEQAGIRSVTRTVWEPGQRRSWIADRDRFALRRLPGHEITVIGDTYLTPDRRDQVLSDMRRALLNEGAIDVWAHTEELTTPEQIAAWQAAIDVALRDFWVAPVPEIVQYAQAVRAVTVAVEAEQPEYRFVVRNDGRHDLRGLTLTLPFAPRQITIDGAETPVTGTTLRLDLPRGEARAVTLTWPTTAASARQETAWPA